LVSTPYTSDTVSRVSETKQENQVDICTENKTTLVCVYIHIHTYIYAYKYVHVAKLMRSCVCERIDIIISGTVYRPFLILSPRESRCVRTRKPQKGFAGHWTMAKSDWQRCKEIAALPSNKNASSTVALSLSLSLSGGCRTHTHTRNTHLMTCGLSILISFGCHYDCRVCNVRHFKFLSVSRETWTAAAVFCRTFAHRGEAKYHVYLI